jgi:divalent metal cation (Fe/Co/Zn/Cd) transporter
MHDIAQTIKARIRQYAATVVVVFLLFRAFLSTLSAIDRLIESYLVRAINAVIRSTFPNTVMLPKIELSSESLLTMFVFGIIFGGVGLLLGYWKLRLEKRLQANLSS